MSDLKELPHNWIEVTLEDLLDYIQPNNYIVKSTEYNDQYKTPVLTAGKSFILGYTNEQAGVFSQIPTIIFDDFTTAIKYVDFPFKVKSSAMKILVPTHYEVNIKFVYYFMETIRINVDTHKRYWISIGAKYPISLPPLAEQHRIVAKIEELFAGLNKSIESLKTAQHQLKVYRQAVLKAAFEGDFTADKRLNGKYPEVDSLLLKIRKYQSDNNLRLKYPVIESREDLPNIPKEWTWIRNEALLKYVTSGSRDWKKYYSNKGSIFIRTQDIKTNFLDLTDAAFVSLPLKVEGKRSLVEPYDILMTITGANVGRVAIIPESIPEAFVSQSVALMKLIDNRISKYLWYYFQSRTYGEGLINGLVYGVGRPVLSLENMKEVPVCICSIEEQNDIINEIESRLSVCDKLEESIEQSLQQAEALRHSILKKAFEGKLVPQDLHDEPASVLLERIAAARQNAGPVKRTKKETVVRRKRRV